MDRIPPPSALPDWADPNLDFSAYTPAGTIGDARAGRAELGEALWRASIDWLVDHVLTVASTEQPDE
jgi:creatinine amidohydrolase/Fe(II)-dependent formamide hydrolase-like protein